MILNSEGFRYPSREERKVAGKDLRPIETFPFPYQNKFGFVMQNISVDMPVDPVAIDAAGTRKENLWWWSHCLQNRFGKLRETYIYVMTSYNRGFDDDVQNRSADKVINKLLFDYYAEIFYYFFSSVQDIIAQVLNIYFEFDLDETEVSFDKVLKKIKPLNATKAKNLYTLLAAFDGTTGQATKLRNSFTHRFSPTEPDYRAVLSNINKKKRGNFIKSDKIVKNIKASMTRLSQLMHGVNEKIKEDLEETNNNKPDM